MSGALALYIALKNRPERIRAKNHNDWPEYVPEKTCRMSYTMKSAHDPKREELEELSDAICSTPEDTAGYICNSCGFDFRYERGLYPSYCPNCGAKVVSK